VARGILQSLFMVKPTREALERGLAADPNHASCHYLMAELYLQLLDLRFQLATSRRLWKRRGSQSNTGLTRHPTGSCWGAR